MRRNKAETIESRQRIVTQAARLVREHGPDKVSVADVMQAAGMTHGGFYSHFASKEAMLAAATETAFNEKLDYFDSLAPGKRQRAVLDYIDGYLSAGHAADLSTGCPIAGLSGDATRSGPEFMAAMEDGMRRTLETFQNELPAAGADKRADAIRALVTMVGTMVVARAGSDPALRNEIIGVMRGSEPLRAILKSC